MKLCVLAVFALAGCGDDPPSAYRHPRDRLIAALGGDLFGQRPCFRTIARRPGRLRASDCYRMTAPRRFSGVWVNGFEESGFFPGRRTAPADPISSYWLERDREPLPGAPQLPVRCKDTCITYLDFIGRQTLVPGHSVTWGSPDTISSSIA